MDRLADVVPLPEGQAAAHGRAGGWRDARVECVDVKAQVDRAVPRGVHVVEGELDDTPDAVLVDVVHAERLDAVLLEDGLLARIDVAQADVDDAVGREPRGRRGDPGVFGDDGVVEPEEEGDRHAVDVPCCCGFDGVDVGVCVDPNDAGVGILAANGIRLARKRRVGKRSVSINLINCPCNRDVPQRPGDRAHSLFKHTRLSIHVRSSTPPPH